MIVEKKKEQQSILWKFTEKFALTFFSFLCSMVLARLITPSEYGDYAIVSSIVLVISTFVTNNIVNLVVKEKELNNDKINTIFIYNVVVSIILIICLLLISLVLFKLRLETVSVLLSIQSLNIIILAFQSVYMSLLIKQMKFKKIAFAALISGCVSFVIAIVLATQRMGVYSLIAQYTSNNIILVVMLSFQCKHKFSIQFDKHYIKKNIGFVVSVIISDMIQLLSRTFQNIIVQQTSSSTVLGFYDKGYTLSKTCSDLFYETANTVTFPILSQAQDNDAQIKKIIKSVLYIFTCVCIPVVLAFFSFEKEIIVILFSHLWEDSAYYFKMFFLIYCLVSLNAISSQVLVIKNYYKKYRNITMFFNLTTIILIFIFYGLGVNYIPWIMLGVTILQFITTLFYTSRLIGYGFLHYIESCKMLYLFVIIYIIHYSVFLVASPLGVKLIVSLVYAIAYCLLLWIFDKKNLTDTYDQLLKNKRTGI